MTHNPQTRYWGAAFAALLLFGCAGAPPRGPAHREAPPGPPPSAAPAPPPAISAPPGAVAEPPFEAAGPRFIRVLLSGGTAGVVLEGETIREIGTRKWFAKRDVADVVDLGETILIPGLVNAHCHLDLTPLPPFQ